MLCEVLLCVQDLDDALHVKELEKGYLFLQKNNLAHYGIYLYWAEVSSNICYHRQEDYYKNAEIQMGGKEYLSEI